MKLLEIAEAWIIAENPNPTQKAIAEYRISVCDQCPHKTFNKVFDSFLCGICHCPLSKKVFSSLEGPKACPEARWEK